MATKKPVWECHQRYFKKCSIIPSNDSLSKDMPLSCQLSKIIFLPLIQDISEMARNYELLILWKFDAYLIANKSYEEAFVIWPTVTELNLNV